MSLISIEEFQGYFSKKCAPHAHTVRRWIDEKIIPGLHIGSRYYVDEVAILSMGNPIVAKVMRDVSRSAQS